MKTGITKPKEDAPLSDVDILVMHVDLGQEMARRFRELNEEIDKLKADNKRLSGYIEILEARLDDKSILKPI